ncbi:MAG: hypothetical protein NVSMB9_33970 [Isosphaeraceae bacterium]
MLRRDLIRALMATPLAAWLRPWMPPTFGGAAIGEPNAAVIYRKVFGWTIGSRPEDRERLRKAATTEIDDPIIDVLIRKNIPVLKAIREAAAIHRCDWSTENITSDDLGKGHLDVSSVNVIRIACLSARRHASLGRGQDALDDVFAGLTLAHRVGTGGFLFARLLECGGEVPAFQTLGRILPELDRATIDELARRLEVLPPPEPASAAIRPESRFILGMLRTRIMAIGPVVQDAEWTGLGFDDAETSALKRMTGGDRSRLLTHLEANGSAFAELARRLDLPRPGCRAALDEFARAEKSIHPIPAGLVESAWGVRHVVDRMRALRSMLHAGLVLIRDGEPAFRAEPDPFGTGAFGLERRGKGYLIRSAMNDEEKPEVSLEIGDAS